MSSTTFHRTPRSASGATPAHSLQEQQGPAGRPQDQPGRPGRPQDGRGPAPAPSTCSCRASTARTPGAWRPARPAPCRSGRGRHRLHRPGMCVGLQGLHHRLPVGRPAVEPRERQGRQVRLLQGPRGRGAEAGLRHGLHHPLPHFGLADRRPSRSHARRSPAWHAQIGRHARPADAREGNSGIGAEDCNRTSAHGPMPDPSARSIEASTCPRRRGSIRRDRARAAGRVADGNRRPAAGRGRGAGADLCAAMAAARGRTARACLTGDRRWARPAARGGWPSTAEVFVSHIATHNCASGRRASGWRPRPAGWPARRESTSPPTCT